MKHKLNLASTLKNIKDYFSPRVVGEVNDVFIKVAKIKGDEIPWHNHKNEDEMFYILSGQLLFEEENKDPFILSEGDMYIVKKGVNHKVSADEECHIMLIENKTTAHTGEVISKITRSIDEQLDL
jgi:quercetin dioxygenase-like cupin family protein